MTVRELIEMLSALPPDFEATVGPMHEEVIGVDRFDDYREANIR